MKTEENPVLPLLANPIGERTRIEEAVWTEDKMKIEGQAFVTDYRMTGRRPWMLS